MVEQAYQFLNDVVSNNGASDKLWRTIAAEVKRNYQVSFSKADIATGYFLSSLFQKSNLRFKYQLLAKGKECFRTPNVLHKDFV